MSKRNLIFSANQLIFDNQESFGLDDFSSIEESVLDPFTIQNPENPAEKEVLIVKRINKKNFENRFVGFSFVEGEKYPYAAKVIGPGLEEHDNPRPPEDIEMRDQFFVLIDIKTQRIFISDLRKRNGFRLWLEQKLDRTITIKSIIGEDDFISRIKSLEQISFSLVPNIFALGRTDTLSNHLVQDIYGFDAKIAEIKLSYEHKKINDVILKKLRELIGQKEALRDIVIIGRDEDNFESVFNLKEIISKISISVPMEFESRLLDDDKVFRELIDFVR